VIGDDTPQQTEYIEKMIIESFKHFKGKARRIVFNASERFDSFVESFDTFVSDFDYGTIINDLVSEINTRQVEAENEPMFVYVPDANTFGDKTFISNEAIDTIFRKAQKVNIYFIFEGNQKQIENSYDDFNKRLRNNIPAGMIGTRLADQNLVNVKSTYSEPAVGTDEGHMFIGRLAGRIKLVSE
jgi:S-DNA-T family DNA segregation ATPase FtsK/SpoIIIE